MSCGLPSGSTSGEQVTQGSGGKCESREGLEQGNNQDSSP